MPLHTLPSLPPSYRRLVSVISCLLLQYLAPPFWILCVFGPHCLNWCNFFFSSPLFFEFRKLILFRNKIDMMQSLSSDAFQFVPMCLLKPFFTYFLCLMILYFLGVNFTMILLNSWQDLQFGCLFLRFFLLLCSITFWLNEAKRSLVRWFSAAHEKNGLLTFFFFFCLVKR